MFLIQECLDSFSEHELQQMEDPSFLESSVWQWNPSSTLLITMIAGNKNQSCTRSHTFTKVWKWKLYSRILSVLRRTNIIQEPTKADYCYCSVWTFCFKSNINKAWSWKWKAWAVPWLKGVGRVPLYIPGSPASETWFLSTTCRHKNLTLLLTLTLFKLFFLL